LREEKIKNYRSYITDQILYDIYKKQTSRMVWFGHVWRVDRQVIKEVLVNKINKKRPLGIPRTRWVDVVNIKNIKKDSVFDDAYDREKWRGFVMALNGLTRKTKKKKT